MTDTTKTKDTKPRTPKRDPEVIEKELEERLAKLREKKRLQNTPGLKELRQASKLIDEALSAAKNSAQAPRIAGLCDGIDSLIADLEK